MNIEHTEITCSEQDSMEGCCGLLLWCGGRALGHLEMMTVVAFQSYVILDAQKQNQTPKYTTTNKSNRQAFLR